MGLTREQLLKKIAGATTSGGGINLRDGRGRIAVKTMLLQDGFKGSRFVMEGVIVSSAKIPVTELKTGKTLDINPNEPGTDISWVQMLDEHESAFGAVKDLVLKLYGEDESSITNEDFIATLDELTTKNSALGMVVDFGTYRKVTRANSIEIVLPKWATVEQSPDDIKAMKKWLESLTSQAQTKASA